MRVLRGNLHVHSQESDGTGSLAEIAGVAAQCGLDFVGINDHHVICGKSQYINGVLFLMGTEFNTCHNHYLAYHTPVSFENKQVKAAPLIEAVKKSGGIGIIAHPFEKGSNIVSFGKRYPWLDWDVQGFDAIELWNLTSQWRDAATSYFRALYLWLFKRHGPFYQGPNPQAMAKWDQLCLCRHVSGLAGSDLHAPIFRVLGLSYRVLDYPMLFSAVNNYVQVEGGNGDAKEDSAALLAALGQGKCWFALDTLGLASDFSFFATAGSDGAGMGEALSLDGERAWLHVHTPQPGRIRLYRNGKLLLQRETKKTCVISVNTGIYRVEIKVRRRRYLPWLYSNPIYIGKRE